LKFVVEKEKVGGGFEVEVEVRVGF